MPILETPETIIELIESQKATLSSNPSVEMDLVIKHVSSSCLKALARHFEPVSKEDAINLPTETNPYFHFSKRINERLFIQLRTPSLTSNITFK